MAEGLPAPQQVKKRIEALTQLKPSAQKGDEGSQ
jgi:hypothetical protein